MPIFSGDNLQIMQGMKSESVDLIYLDPPFCTGKDWSEFNDKWTDRKSYLDFMEVRLIEMKRLLKKTGSIYLHCDPTMSHYLKLIMDAIFGFGAFRNEVVWSNEDVSGFKSQAVNWVRGHDVLLYYLKGSDFTFNKEYLPLDIKTIKRYDKVDTNGRRYKIYRNKDGAERFSYLREDRGAACTATYGKISQVFKR